MCHPNYQEKKDSQIQGDTIFLFLHNFNTFLNLNSVRKPLFVIGEETVAKSLDVYMKQALD